MKSNKGITLLTLTITIVILMILTFTVSANVSTYVERNNRTNLETDIIKLKEEISYYYSTNKKLPISKKYTNTDMLIKNINYYIIDLIELKELGLNYGKDYQKIENKNENINNLLDIYIINEKTHTIYYPKGIQYNNEIIYTTLSLGKIQIEDIPISKIEITGQSVGRINETIQLTETVIPEFTENTGVMWSSSDETLATVNENGKVTLLKEGTVTINAISKDNNSISASHTIVIK